MTIERMEHVAVLSGAASAKAALDWLYNRREVHLLPFRDAPEDWRKRFKPLDDGGASAEAQVSHLQHVVSFLRPYCDQRRDFLSGIFPVKTLATRDELSNAARTVDVAAIYSSCHQLGVRMDAAGDERARLLAQRARLAELRFVAVPIRDIRNLEFVGVRFVVAGKSQRIFLEDDRLRRAIGTDALAVSNSSTVYALYFPSSLAGELGSLISDYSLRELSLPEVEGTVADEIVRIDNALQDAAATQSGLCEEARLLARDFRALELALAHWEACRDRAVQTSMAVNSDSVFAARGYVRRKAMDKLRSDFEAAFPGAALVPTRPPQGEEPPVSLAWNHFVRPAGLLVKMFGLPRYNTFDPTPFLMLTFLTFFGICFGDLVYGIMLIAIAGWLRRRFAGQKHLVEFFRLFTYAGVTTIVFGVLTGSWASDLTAYLGPGNFLDRLRVKLTLLDMMQKPIVALGIAVAIGVVNQFYGLVLRFLSYLWRGDFKSGFYDGALWIFYLASLLIWSVSAVGILPLGLAGPSLVVLAASAVGLVLTQGRDQKGWGPRLITGLVSLYGILGAYGTTSFMGDVLSYSRLLALGLTTSVIGMAFNMIAGFLKAVPAVGIVLFILMCAFGHSFNFVMSILGSFVHPARLIFLEFFGRFYESGGAVFRPFGFQADSVQLTD